MSVLAYNFVKIRRCLPELWQLIQGYSFFRGQCIYLPVGNFLCFISAKNSENWLRVDKVIAMNTMCSFFGPPGTTGVCYSAIALRRQWSLTIVIVTCEQKVRNDLKEIAYFGTHSSLS